MNVKMRPTNPVRAAVLRDRARVDAVARAILRAEHRDGGHRPGDRPDLCALCSADSGGLE